jgi:hypothetical protein
LGVLHEPESDQHQPPTAPDPSPCRVNGMPRFSEAADAVTRLPREEVGRAVFTAAGALFRGRQLTGDQLRKAFEAEWRENRRDMS